MANALLVVLSGATISLTIEMIQAWLPNRVSSMTDFLTNITGTLLGVLVAILVRARVGNEKLS
jgi:VanZ family protein